jgi:hypothetical protein
MSSPKTLASLDRTDPMATAEVVVDCHRRSRAHLDKQFTYGWTGCSRAWALPPATTQDLDHPRVPGADRRTGQRRTLVSIAGLERAFCCQARATLVRADAARRLQAELDRLPPGDG